MNPYEVLKLKNDFTKEELSEATKNAIKEAKLMYDGDEKKIEFEVGEILDAFRILNNPESRKEYEVLVGTLEEVNKNIVRKTLQEYYNERMKKLDELLTEAYKTGDPDIYFEALRHVMHEKNTFIIPKDNEGRGIN